MHPVRKISILLLGIVLCLSACSGRKGTERSVSFFAMDTYMTLRAYGCGQETLDGLKAETERLEGLFSVTRPDSEIARLNAEGSIVPSADVRDAVGKALALAQESGGALDIALYPLLTEWGFTTGQYQVPGAERIRELLAAADWRQIELSDAGLRIAPGMALDLGSLAKGYTADVLTKRLKEAGVTSALLDLGGNIQAVGAKPDGSSWQIGIRDPQGEGHLGVVSAADMAVVTSGGYERYFTGEDGRVYWHILDPATGCPARSGLLSVTVIGSEGWRCDGLSTALFVMGPEKAREHWRQAGNYELVLVTEDGEVIVTDGLAGSFTLSQPDKYTLTVWKRDTVRNHD
ncbi:MAG: FAD:protein FMN transferase [Lachnospiraceae bacterium]|nr:FAD:protein FMN transferase [Lachnospiraceae bacterium]